MKKIVSLFATVLLAGILFQPVAQTSATSAYQVTSVSGRQTVAPGGSFQIKVYGHVGGGSSIVQINPSAYGITFDASGINYVKVNPNGVVTVSPNVKGGLYDEIMIHLNDGVTSSSFNVVLPSHLTDISLSYAKPAINRLVQMRAVSGYPDNTFHPHQTVTREEFTAILERAEHDLTDPMVTSTSRLLTGGPNYMDNQNQNAWYYPWLNNNTIVPPLTTASSREQELFGVGKAMSRQDAMYSIMQTFLNQDTYWIMHNMYPNRSINWNTFHAFTDVGQNAKYYEEITSAKYFGITSGYGDGSFHPNDTITREMAAQLIDKAIAEYVALDAQRYFGVVYEYQLPYMYKGN